MPFYWCHQNLIIFAEFFQPMCWWNFMYIDFLVLYGWILKRTNDTGIHPLLPIFRWNAFYIWNICISWISLHICPTGAIRPDDKCKHFNDKGYSDFGEYLSHYPYRQWLMITDAYAFIQMSRQSFAYAYAFMHMSTHIFLSIWISLSMPHINNPIVITVNHIMLH